MKLILILLGLCVVSPAFCADAPAKKKAPSKATVTEASKKKATAAAQDEASAKAQALAKTLTPSQETQHLEIINKGDDKSLQSLPGIGETRAVAVKKARPLKEPVDLMKIDGIGEGVFADIVAHAKAGFPEATKPEGADAEPDAEEPPTAESSAVATRPLGVGGAGAGEGAGGGPGRTSILR